MANNIDILINARNQSRSAFTQVREDMRGIDQAAAALSSGLSGIGSIVGISAVVAGLQQIGSEIDQIARRSAIFGQLRDVLDTFAASVGETTKAFVEAGRAASAGTIGDFDLILNANRAIQFEVAKTSEEYAKLIELATALGRAQGVNDTQALEFITTGIARESRLILDNLGLIIDLDDATKTYAQTIGKTADQLTQAERKTALLNAAFEQGTVAIEANRAAFDSAATRFERADAAIQNAKDSLGELFAPSVAQAAENIAGGVQMLIEGIIRLQELGLVPLDPGDKPVNSWLGLADASDKYLASQQQIKDQQAALAAAFGGATDATNGQRAALLAQAEAEKRAAQEAVELEKALTSVPDQLERLARIEITLERKDAGEVTGLVNQFKDEFVTLEKLQDSTKQKLIANAVKASDIIGDDRAFELAEQQISALQDRIETLGVRLFSGEIDDTEFLFELQKLPIEVAQIFEDVSAAGGEGLTKLQEKFTNLTGLRDAIEINVGVNADTAQLDAVNAEIAQLESVLNIVNPSFVKTQKGLNDVGAAASGTVGFVNSLVGAYTDAAAASDSYASGTATAANETNLMVSALAGAPPALAAMASAMIAAGADASAVAAQVSAVTGEFLRLQGIVGGVQRQIFSRAAGISSIVGDERALAIATEQVQLLTQAQNDLGQQLLDNSIGNEEYEFQLAKLNGTYTEVFSNIETADRKSKSLAKTVGGDLSQAFSNLQSKVSSVLSGALNVDVGVNTDSLLPREDAINEDARRLADVAVRGWDSPWASYLSQKFPDLVGKAFDSGGDVKQTAARLLRDFEDGLVPQLIDKDTAKERVRRALIGDQNMAALAKEIATELSAEFGGQFSVGQIRATAGVALGVDGAETEQLTSALTSATTGVQEKLSGLGTSLKTGIVSALDGIGEAVTNAISKQLSAENNLKQIQQSGYDNGIVWGNGFLESMDELTSQVLEKLAGLVAPYVEDRTRQTATLQGAN